ncbi:arsenite methyltransferase [Halorussus sp. MSC15.2]|uniref:arsenite methyltransferase n=1 Tax=Halorussus sp. MSC15.2 TaxID=2283638 RepID=UPI0013D2D715|nr:arsenite methyltransferase [Halorussus sp. MSC15.2]NEU57042.1 arsenite methyltransferase [Halorussus sp. MSC15.2]
MTDDAPTAETDREGLTDADQRTAVRERYSRIAAGSSSTESSCCDGTDSCGDTPADESRKLGYSDADLDAVDGDANLGLGCGNPTAIASLEAGDTVLDLGSGGGFDCFLAAREVGESGRVVGVDMTPEMVETARENVEANDASNVEFRLGEIEHLPVADASVDVILSNCVVNLSPDKPQVFREAYRVLRPGGRLAVSDVVLTAELPDGIRTDPTSVAACVGGAASIPALDAMLTDAGFTDVSIEPKSDSDEFIREWDDERDLSDYVVAARIEAEKPASGQRPSRGDSAE